MVAKSNSVAFSAGNFNSTFTRASSVFENEYKIRSPISDFHNLSNKAPGSVLPENSEVGVGSRDAGALGECGKGERVAQVVVGVS